MCDTIVATGDVTADGVAVFAKNSDREPNEAQHLLFVPAQDHEPGSRVRCTYIEIPQAGHTYAVLISKPFHIWGAEMGANEHGVVIGNESIFSRLPAQKKPALIGMDLLRLALERAATARQAVEVITGLLAEHGQGGNCGFAHPFYYHNSYLIADPQDAWVLEMVDRHWAARQVRGVYTISNILTIGAEWDMASPDLVDFAIQKGWCRDRTDFHFASCYSDTLYTRFAAANYRQQCTMSGLAGKKGRINVAAVMALLRDHGDWGRGGKAPETGTRSFAQLHGESTETWRPDQGVLGGVKVCMHAGWGPVRINQVTASQVSHLDPQRPTHFFTATAAACTSLFKPVWLEAAAQAGLPDTGPEPNGKYDPATLFWRHERLHRLTLLDYPTRIRAYQDERDVLEADFTARALACAAGTPEERAALSAEIFTQADAAEARWLERVQSLPLGKPPGRLYRMAWNRFNREANFPGA